MEARRGSPRAAMDTITAVSDCSAQFRRSADQLGHECEPQDGVHSARSAGTSARPERLLRGPVQARPRRSRRRGRSREGPHGPLHARPGCTRPNPGPRERERWARAQHGRAARREQRLDEGEPQGAGQSETESEPPVRPPPPRSPCCSAGPPKGVVFTEDADSHARVIPGPQPGSEVSASSSPQEGTVRRQRAPATRAKSGSNQEQGSNSTTPASLGQRVQLRVPGEDRARRDRSDRENEAAGQRADRAAAGCTSRRGHPGIMACRGGWRRGAGGPGVPMVWNDPGRGVGHDPREKVAGRPCRPGITGR